MFYSQEETEFATCQVGNYKTNRPTNFNDSEQDELELQEFKAGLSSSKKPFPDPTNPTPHHDGFYAVPMEEQFVYIMPILELIVENRYPPASDRHSMFLRGGKSRSQLSQSAGANGTLYKLEVDKLLACIVQWLRQRSGDTSTSTPILMDSELQHADESGDIPGPSNVTHHNGLDNEQRQETYHANTTTPTLNAEVGGAETPLTSEVPIVNPGAGHNEEVEVIKVDGEIESDKGGEMSANALPEEKSCKLEFKDLQKQDMVDYASNVLLPEATYQLLLWRTGERNSLEPLSEAEESRLHDRGHQLAQQVDIVKSIERLRELKRKMIFGKAANESSTPQKQLPAGALGGTRSRPKLT